VDSAAEAAEVVRAGGVSAASDVAGGPVSADDVAQLLLAALDLRGPQDLDQTYFAAGGDSLTAIQVVTRLRDEFGVDAPLDLFLEQVQLRDLVTRIATLDDGADDGLLASLLDEIEAED